jgi:hypothetical protein
MTENKTIELYLLQIKRGKKSVAFHPLSLKAEDVAVVESLQKILRFKLKRIEVANPSVS